MSFELRIQMRIGVLDIDVELAGGNTPVALIGPNGSGKTTVLRTIAGAHRPLAGRIEVGESVFVDTDRDIDLPPERRRVGYVPQGYGLFPHLRVLDNVAFGLTPRTDRRRAAAKLLDRMECGHLADRAPKTLSGGEQQRVALARALLIEPRILLLDEPLSALDAPARRTLRGYLATHVMDRGRPALVVTHDMRDVRALDATVYAIEDGRVVQHGSADELSAEPATDFVAEFFGQS